MPAYMNDANWAFNCTKHRLISLNLQELRFGTEWYQFVPFGTRAQHDSPYRSSIRHRETTSRGETTPEELSDRKKAASVADDTTSANIEDSIDRRIKEMHQHEYWRTSTNIEARIRILE
jgi:hypothetical protein